MARSSSAFDWPTTLPVLHDEAAQRQVRSEALRRVSAHLPAACRLHGVPGWLATAPVEPFLRDLTACLIAADRWNTRRRYPGGSAWLTLVRYQYLARVRVTAVAVASAALARWAILEKIPQRWLPEQHLRAALNAQLKESGIDAEVTSLALNPPVTGGSDWVRKDCGHGVELLARHAPRSAVTAVLHWADRTMPAVVLSTGSSLTAFTASCGEQGMRLDPDELVGADVVPAHELPARSTVWLLVLVGLSLLVWLLRWSWR
jgi:hypothetical protein